jgi:plasmid stabilization system protein ParE
MTTYSVFVEDRVWLDAEAIVRRISADNLEAAAKWFRALQRKIEALRFLPERHPLAPENDDFTEEIRETFLGKRNNKYRILFTIRGKSVHVLHVRHGAREPLRPTSQSES